MNTPPRDTDGHTRCILGTPFNLETDSEDTHSSPHPIISQVIIHSCVAQPIILNHIYSLLLIYVAIFARGGSGRNPVRETRSLVGMSIYVATVLLESHHG